MPKDLRSFLQALEEQTPGDVRRVKREINPRFEIAALQQHLENEDQFPLLLCEQVKNLKGELSGCSVAANVFASRGKCAVALDLPADKWRMETSYTFARRSANRIKPVLTDRADAPVKEVIRTGEAVDLRELPILTHHEMDGYPYLVDVVVAPDPDTGVYNASHHRMLVRGKDELGLWMSPRHLWDYCRRAWEKGKPLPIAHVIGHHPGFYLASEALVAMETDEYEVIGGVLNEPLRLVPSEAFGDSLLVPADAEIVVEGEVIPNRRDAEGPFGEFTGYYGPQRWSPVVKVKAITRRRDACYLNILAGHPDTAILGGIPKEASICEEVRKSVPGVQAVHFPISGCCRFHAYIAIDKQVDGEGKVAALAALPYHDELKMVIVVDKDIDVFNEREVLWAVATRIQAGSDVDIIKGVRGGSLDPSSTVHAVGDKLLIDATKPVTRPFPERINVPDSVLRRIRPDEWLRG
ncbi:MAG: UbiD family decarboxylase [bacterium]|jgi:2,5-furandicarboxylate decarboxylase 1